MGDTGGSGVIGFFFIVVIFAITLGLGALFALGVVKKIKALWITTGILLLPLLVLSAPIAFELIKYAIDQRIKDSKSRPIIWANMRDDLNSLINKYYIEHPESFNFEYNSEAVSSPDLLEYLSKSDVFRKSGFSIVDGSIFSPFGDYVLFAIDKNHDGIFLTNNEVISSPWPEKQYSCVLIRHTSTRERAHPDWKRLN